MKKKSLYLCMNFVLILCLISSVFCTTSLEKQRSQSMKWLWNTARVFGPLVVMGYVVYQSLKPSSKMIGSLSITEVKITPAQQQSLTKEQYEKYKNAGNRFGYTTVLLSWAMLLSGTPLFIPFIAASYGGALYNGMKGLQLSIKPYVYPISLEQIQIKPAEMPY
jgi:p-aminobenzoyl-glutamate transporter AbgT